MAVPVSSEVKQASLDRAIHLFELSGVPVPTDSTAVKEVVQAAKKFERYLNGTDTDASTNATSPTGV